MENTKKQDNERVNILEAYKKDPKLKVQCKEFGIGSIVGVDIKDPAAYPLAVKFESISRWFSKYGEDAFGNQLTIVPKPAIIDEATNSPILPVAGTPLIYGVLRDKAVAMYPTVGKYGKETLIELFGESIIKDSAYNKFEGLIENYQLSKEKIFKIEKQAEALKELLYIIAALNEGWEPSGNDLGYRILLHSDQTEFVIHKALSILSFKGLCFKTKEAAEYALENYKHMYETFYEVQ